MGKKGGKNVNPADQQRKLDRKRELKRNKKQRVETREAVVKSRDPEEVIDQLRRIDHQIYDPETPTTELLQTKRKKMVGSYISVIAHHRAQKNLEKVKELQNMLNAYENERRDMEERYNAQVFAKEGNLNIPLPGGFFDPEDAMTPASMIPMPPPAPKIHSGILKKPIERKYRRIPPGPPCIPPPDFEDFGEYPIVPNLPTGSSRRVNFGEPEEVDDGNYDPVEIPAEVLNHGLPSLGQLFPNVMTAPLHQHRPPPVVPVAPQPPRLPVISAPAQVAAPSVGPSQPIISAKPQMRDLWRETTRFVPTNVQVKKAVPAKPKKPFSYSSAAPPKPKRPLIVPVMSSDIDTTVTHVTVENTNKKEPKTTDDICDDFLASLGDLI
uniref:WW domain-binding protein 11 n=1 Tax=Panagrellus redivivus TaxID=6233 RepID=A0A7E4UZM8_PANRE